MFKLVATDEQVLKMAALAANASTMMGMGVVHFKEETQFKAEDFEISSPSLPRRDEVYLDYVEGRMVKFYGSKDEETGEWEFRDGEVNIEYQSWGVKYPTYMDLAKAAGVIQ